MTTQTKEPARDTVTNLAAKIYMELICRNVVVTESAAQIKSNPENLARISFKLAEAFQRVEADVKGGGAPKNQNFDVNDVDLSNWGGAKA
jgi:hypothetical protein